MVPKTCSVDECSRAHNARGFCKQHYAYFSRRGQLPPRLTEVQRFWLKVHKTENCWNWTGAISTKGYGQFRFDGRSGHAHRFSFIAQNGDIPPELLVDHICHNRRCVNPEHLRAATPKQNEENRAGASVASSSGIRGVGWHEATQKWRGFVVHSGRFYHVGLFPTAQEAEAAVVAKRLELFTHNELDRKGTR